MRLRKITRSTFELNRRASLYQKRSIVPKNCNAPNLVLGEIEDYELSKFVQQFNGRSIVHQKIDINCTDTALCSWLMRHGYAVRHINKNVFFASTTQVFIAVDVKNWIVSVKMCGDVSAIDVAAKQLDREFVSSPCYVKYVYDPQYMEYTTLPINTDRQPVEEMYPWLGETLHSFYDRFVNSSANILILTGIPGSGKTTFIRGLLSYTKQSAMLAYHPKIIEQDSFFVQWIESSDMFMVLEDADNLITPRADGNDIMSKFLNIGDGLMSFRNKKIVLSTNLPNVSAIDSALTRSGRCFDVVEFDYLSRTEAQKLANRVSAPLGDGDKFTVSDIFSASKNEAKFAKENQSKRSFGFTS